MPQSTKPLASADEIITLELLFHLYLFGRKIKHQVKQNHPEHIQDQMLEFGILKLVAQTSRSISELAQLLSTGLSAMSERIKSLKDLGLIDQTTGSDGREMRCQLTQLGQTKIAQTKVKMAQACGQFTQVLSTDELSQLNNLIKKLIFTPQAEETALQ